MIKENIEQVRLNIEAACKRAGRDIKEVTLIAVSKTKPVSDIREAIAAGMREFGENKPQELRDKMNEITDTDINWHMIGSLQTNKLKYVVGKTKLIHSVDSIELAKALNLECKKRNTGADILLEVNIAGETSKHGFKPENVTEAIKEIALMDCVHIKGLMTVAPFTENSEDNRCYFRKMKELFVDIKSKNIDNVIMEELSMGMTGDYEIAVEEGATLVRVGTGIFGKRDYSLGDDK